MKLGADVNRSRTDGAPPLYIAANLGKLEALTALVKEYKADIHKATKTGVTPMHSAALGGHPKCIQVLKDAGADVNAKTNAGKTPLDLAKENKRADAITLLEKLGGHAS